jgi:hypothetical protein
MNTMDTMNTMVPKLLQRLQELLRHAHLNIVVPVLVAAGLLSYVASLASTPQAARELVVVARHVWWIVLALIFPYLALRLYLWRDLLRLLNLKVPFRRLLLAFAAGEMTKNEQAKGHAAD